MLQFVHFFLERVDLMCEMYWLAVPVLFARHEPLPVGSSEQLGSNLPAICGQFARLIFRFLSIELFHTSATTPTSEMGAVQFRSFTQSSAFKSTTWLRQIGYLRGDDDWAHVSFSAWESVDLDYWKTRPSLDTSRKIGSIGHLGPCFFLCEGPYPILCLAPIPSFGPFKKDKSKGRKSATRSMSQSSKP